MAMTSDTTAWGDRRVVHHPVPPRTRRDSLSSIEILEGIHRNWSEEEELDNRNQLVKLFRNEIRVHRGLGPLRRFLERWVKIHRATGERYNLARQRLFRRQELSRRSLLEEENETATKFGLELNAFNEGCSRVVLQHRCFFYSVMLLRGVLCRTADLELHRLMLFSDASLLVRAEITEASDRRRLEEMRVRHLSGTSANLHLLLLPSKETSNRHRLLQKEDEEFVTYHRRFWYVIRYHARRDVEATEYEVRRTLQTQMFDELERLVRSCRKRSSR